MVVNRKSTPMPEPIAQLQRQLDQFRSTQPRRTKLPESLWQGAVELARQHGVYSVAPPLRLDYMGLKKRLGGASTRRRKATKAAFVELIGPDRAQLEEGPSPFRRYRPAVRFFRGAWFSNRVGRHILFRTGRAVPDGPAVDRSLGMELRRRGG